VSDATPPASSAAPPDRFRDALEAALTPSYALGRELGGGGMSRVFLAEERSLGRTVVVKVLPPDLAAGVNRDRFRREIQLAARLQHPHIVPLLAAGEVEGSLYYTMPYIEGESVRGALARGRRFGVREMVRVLHDVIDALAYAHERGIIHRDVKPGNVLLQGAHALVTDFGVAKALSAARGGTDGSSDPFVTVTGATSTGLAIGTPAYMAPEQLAADPSADHRVDLYAAGLLAYELCTGASPFVSDSPRATLAAQLTRMPEPLDQLRPDVPPALSDVIMRCLAKEPADRPPTAEALLAELEAAVLGASLSSGGRSAGAGGDEGLEGAITPRSGATTPVTAAGAGPDGVAFTAPANRPVLAHAPATGAMPAPQVERRAAVPATAGGERRHAWLVAGIVAGAGMALLAGVAFSKAREGTPVPAPTSVAAVTPPAALPAPAAPTAPPPALAPTPYERPRLTREDSLAIAAAVERRLAAETRARREVEDPPMAPQEVEAMRAQAWQRYADSVRESVTRQFGPELARGIGAAAARAMAGADGAPGGAPGGAPAPAMAGSPRAGRRRTRRAGRPAAHLRRRPDGGRLGRRRGGGRHRRRSERGAHRGTRRAAEARGAAGGAARHRRRHRTLRAARRRTGGGRGATADDRRLPERRPARPGRHARGGPDQAAPPGGRRGDARRCGRGGLGGHAPRLAGPAVADRLRRAARLRALGTRAGAPRARHRCRRGGRGAGRRTGRELPGGAGARALGAAGRGAEAVTKRRAVSDERPGNLAHR
jgi:serine/threonine-protein kinase